MNAFGLITLVALATTVEGIFDNSTNSKGKSVADNNPAVWTETAIWGPMLEQWAIGGGSNRDDRVMKLDPVENGYVKGPGKIVNKQGTLTGGRQVSETDLYLLAAIEKLVYRADFMEKRLRRVEEMLYFVMAGSRVDQEPCPEGFTRAGMRCYFFADLAGREKDWKAASKECMRRGAVLAELESIEENQDVVAHVQSNGNLHGKDFWIGGLNPGLLWIWSDSARPVGNSTGPIRGDGRCLRLAFNPGLRSYEYRGSDCSARYQFACELKDKTSSNELRRIAKEKGLEL